MSDEKDVVSIVKEKRQPIADMEAEIKRLEIEQKKLELVDLQERIDERKLKREEKSQRSLTNGTTLRQLAQSDAMNQARCNHRKGGNGAAGIIAGQGDDPQFAVFKHTFCNGDTWVRCLRCGKTWKPPLRDDYKTDEAYLGAVAKYNSALEFQTRNTTSSSLQFRFSDGGAHYRDVLRNTTLR